MAEVSKEYLEEFGESLKQLIDRFGAASPEIVKLVDAFKKVEKESAKFSEVTRKRSDDFANAMLKIGKEVRRGESSFTDQQRLLRQLNTAIEEAIEAQEDSAEIQKLVDQKKELAEKAHQQNAKEQWEKFGETLGTGAKNAAGSLVTGAGQFVKGLQANASGTELAAGLMSTAIDVASAGAGVAAKGMTAAGTAMASSMNPLVAGAGALVSGLGAAADAAREVAAKVAKFGVEVAAKEVEKTVKAFNSMSASGTMFANGMTGMRASAHAAGLTVEQFSQVVKGSSAQLASSGMSVAEAAQYTGKVMAAGGGKMQQSLLKLGYGFEEQGALVADVMQAMRGSAAGPLRATEAQVAEQTQKYAENLRVIAAITGEDAKKRQDEARQASANIAFQAELAKMGPEQRAGIQSAMENMTDQQRKNFVDMMVFGTIINKTGAQMAAQMPSVAQFTQDQVRDARAGVLDGRRTLENQKKHAEQNQRELLAFGSTIGKAGLAGVGGAAGELSEAMGRELPQIGKFTAEGITAAEEAAAKQKEATDGLTDSVVDAEKAAQKLKVALEETLTPAITNFAAVSAQMLKGVQDMMDEMGFGKKAIKTDQDKQVDQAETAANEAEKKRDELEKQQDMNWLGRRLSRNFNIGGDENLEKANQEASDKELRADQAKQAKEIYDQGLKAAMAQEQSRLNREKHGALGSMIHGNVAMTDEQRQKIEEQYRTKGFEEYSKSRGYAAAGKQAHEVITLSGDTPRYASGGITTGVSIAGESGPEAVVPLPDGKTIPVNINAQDRGEKDLSGVAAIANQISASIKNSMADSKPISVQLAMSMEKELLPGLKEFSGLNIGPMRTDLRIVAAMAEKLGAFTQAGGGTITDTKTWKELLGYGTTYDLGDEKVNALGSFQDTRNLKMEDFSKQIQDLVEQFKQDRAAGQTVTPEQAASNIADSNKEMVDLMQQQLTAMQEQTSLTRNLINEQQRGNRVSRDILTASY